MTTLIRNNDLFDEPNFSFAGMDTKDLPDDMSKLDKAIYSRCMRPYCEDYFQVLRVSCVVDGSRLETKVVELGFELEKISGVKFFYGDRMRQWYSDSNSVDYVWTDAEIHLLKQGVNWSDVSVIMVNDIELYNALSTDRDVMFQHNIISEEHRVKIVDAFRKVFGVNVGPIVDDVTIQVPIRAFQ